MRSRILFAVLIGLWTSVAVRAEPAKAPVAKSEHSAEKPPVEVAAISTESHAVISKAAHNAAPADAKPRRARVTTCRCGDQTPNRD